MAEFRSESPTGRPPIHQDISFTSHSDSSSSLLDPFMLNEAPSRLMQRSRRHLSSLRIDASVETIPSLRSSELADSFPLPPPRTPSSARSTLLESLDGRASSASTSASTGALSPRYTSGVTSPRKLLSVPPPSPNSVSGYWDSEHDISALRDEPRDGTGFVYHGQNDSKPLQRPPFNASGTLTARRVSRHSQWPNVNVSATYSPQYPPRAHTPDSEISPWSKFTERQPPDVPSRDLLSMQGSVRNKATNVRRTSSGTMVSA